MKVTQILGVVDFSSSSQAAIHYAVHIARLLHATLTLAALPSLVISPDRTPNDSIVTDQLIALAKKTAFTYNISCSFDSALVGVNRFELIERSMKTYSLVIFGMGELADYAPTINDYILSTAHKKFTSCLLLAPAFRPYSPIQQIVHCFELNKNESLHIINLIELAHELKSKIHMLQLVTCKFNRSLETAIFRQQEEIQEMYHKDMVLDFKTIWTSEPTGSTNYFMRTVKADALALSAQHPASIQKLFQTKAVGELASITRYPIILF